MARHGHHQRGLTAKKARIMLKEGKVRGRPLTEAQRGLFGLIASGKRPTRLDREAMERKIKQVKSRRA